MKCEGEATMNDKRKVYVWNVPKILEVERMIDKLTIHFLRHRNGGGEVLHVYYPTTVAGQAIVTFEEKEVALSVLKKQQILEVNGKSYQLKVTPAENSKEEETDKCFPMPIKTALDLRLLPEDTGIKNILFKHGFSVVSHSGSILEIKGFFSDLKMLRRELLQVPFISNPVLPSISGISNRSFVEEQCTDMNEAQYSRNYANRSNSGITCRAEYCSSNRSSDKTLTSSVNGHTAKSSSLFSNMDSDVCNFSSSEKHHALSGVGTGCGTRNNGGRSGSSSFHSVSFQDNSSLDAVSPFWSLPMSFSPVDRSNLEVVNQLPTSDSHAAKKTSQKCTLSVVNSDTLKYVQAFHKDHIDQILERYAITMTVEEEGEISMVTLSKMFATYSAHLDEGCKELSLLFSNFQELLRTHDIELSRFTLSEQEQIKNRSRVLRDIYPVLVISCKDKLHLIGPSCESYELMQKLSGKIPLDESVAAMHTTWRKPSDRRKGKRDSSCPPPARKRDLESSKNPSSNICSHSKRNSFDYNKDGTVPKKQDTVQNIPSSSARHFPQRSTSESRVKKKDPRPPSPQCSTTEESALESSDSQEQRGRSHEKKSSVRFKKVLLPFAQESVRNKFQSMKKSVSKW